MKTDKRNKAQPARLDADRKAIPLTEIIAHVVPTKRYIPGAFDALVGV